MSADDHHTYVPEGNKPPVYFRPIRPGDNEAVGHLITKVMSEFDCIGPEYSSADPEVWSMYESYSNERSFFWVAERDARIMGCGGFAPLEGSDADTCELRKMYFYPELRGCGAGGFLLAKCMTKARMMGYKKMYLETVARMDKAGALYASRGFKPLPAQEGTTGHSGCDRYFIKHL